MIYDILIIGSGLAGLNSALKAANFGKVLVVTKSKLLDSNSNYAQGGIAAVVDAEDSFKKHIRDTIVAGAHHNNSKAVRYFVRHAPAAIASLQKLGVKFALNFNREAGHTENRIVHVADHSGQSIMATMVKKVRANKNITIWENAFAIDLIVDEKKCFGAEIFYRRTAYSIFASRTILATGGAGQLYECTTNPTVTTGDGIALAARAGCRMKDLEFLQFHPTATPKRTAGAHNLRSTQYPHPPLFLISETLRGEGAKLLNTKGQRFMLRYHKSAELAPRDIVSRAIYEEQKKPSRTPNSNKVLDRKSTRLNSSHSDRSRMPSSA